MKDIRRVPKVPQVPLNGTKGFINIYCCKGPGSLTMTLGHFDFVGLQNTGPEFVLSRHVQMQIFSKSVSCSSCTCEL